jgi:hypothetical protein
VRRLHWGGKQSLKMLLLKHVKPTSSTVRNETVSSSADDVGCSFLQYRWIL